MENPSASRVDKLRKYLPTVTPPLLLLSMLVLSLLVFPASMQAAGPIPLGTAANFGVLGASTVTNTATPTVVTGDLGVSPGSAVTGFPPGIVTGTIYTGVGSNAGPAQADALTAYNDAANTTTNPCGTNLTGTDLGAITVSTLATPLAPGVYCFNTSAGLTGTLYLDFTNPNSVFIFQIGSTLTTASNASVVAVSGGKVVSPSPCNNNVIWQVGSSATLGTGTKFLGDILALTSITATTGVSNIGSLYALNGAVTLDFNAIGACGSLPPVGTGGNDLDVVTGVYRTNINIHNPQNQTVNFCTKVVLPGSGPGKITPLVPWSLGSDHGLFIDCFTGEPQSIQSQLIAAATSRSNICSNINSGNVAVYSVKFTCGQETIPPSQFEGFVVIEVPQKSKDPTLLDVVGKYTTRPGGAAGAASDVSRLQVEVYKPTLIGAGEEP